MYHCWSAASQITNEAPTLMDTNSDISDIRCTHDRWINNMKILLFLSLSLFLFLYVYSVSHFILLSPFFSPHCVSFSPCYHEERGNNECMRNTSSMQWTAPCIFVSLPVQVNWYNYMWLYEKIQSLVSAYRSYRPHFVSMNRENRRKKM